MPIECWTGAGICYLAARLKSLVKSHVQNVIKRLK